MSRGAAEKILPAQDALQVRDELTQELLPFDDAFRRVLGLQTFASDSKPREFRMKFDDTLLKGGRHRSVGFLDLR